MYRSNHEKFLRAIDHMEFHPTPGRPKEKPEVRLKRQIQGRSRRIQTLNQIKKMTRGRRRNDKGNRRMVEYAI